MEQNLALITLLVKDYDEAIEFYTAKLGFTLSQDSLLDDGKRWVVVQPPGKGTASLLLARAVGEEQIGQIGRQAGNRVFLFLHTDDFWRDHKRMLENGVQFREKPREEVYGTVAVFEDLYGNLWDLLQPNSS